MKNYEDFFNEAQQYSEILKRYEENGEIFTDPNFLPTINIKEPNIDFNEEKYIWNRIDEFYTTPIFKKEAIKEEAIQQGELEDSYFTASLARIAKQPELVELLFDVRTKSKDENENAEFFDTINLKCGAVIVYFYLLGKRTPVLIDTLIPFQKETQIPRFSRPSDSSYSPWFCLVEKAYAKLYGSYSAIINGKLSQAIYQLFNYYPIYKSIDSILQKRKSKLNSNNESNTDNQSNSEESLNDNEYLFSLLMKWQYENSVIGADISLNQMRKGVTQEDITNNGLQISQTYLILKARKEEGKNFICLKSPFNGHEWTGDWSSSSNLWTAEMKKKLGFHRKSGTFWMTDTDFFHYFTALDVAEPIDPEDHRKFFTTKLEPGENDGFDINSPSIHLENRQTFVFKPKDENAKTTENIESPKTVSDVKVHITVEKRSPFSDTDTDSQIQILLVYSNDKKIEFDKFSTYNRQTVETRNSFFKFTIHIQDNQPFVVICQRSDKKDFTEELLVSFSCKNDFDLYDVDFPDQLFEEADKVGVMFSNKSKRYENISRKIALKNIDGKEIPSFETDDRDPTFCDHLNLVPSNETSTGYFEYDVSDDQLEPEQNTKEETNKNEDENQPKEMNDIQKDILSLIEKEISSFSQFTSYVNTNQLDINQFNDSFEKINQISNDSNLIIEKKIQPFFKTVRSLVLSCMTHQLECLEEYNKMTSNESKYNNDSKYEELIQKLCGALEIDQNDAGFEAVLNSVSQLKNENEELQKKCDELEQTLQKQSQISSQSTEIQKSGNEIEQKEIEMDENEPIVAVQRSIILDINENQNENENNEKDGVINSDSAQQNEPENEERVNKFEEEGNEFKEQESANEQIQQEEEEKLDNNNVILLEEEEIKEQEIESQQQQEDELIDSNQQQEEELIESNQQQQEDELIDSNQQQEEEQLNENETENHSEQQQQEEAVPLNENESLHEEEIKEQESENQQKEETPKEAQIDKQQEEEENKETTEQSNSNNQENEEEKQPDESQKPKESENDVQQENGLEPDEQQTVTDQTQEQKATKEEADQEQEQPIVQSRGVNLFEEAQKTESATDEKQQEKRGIETKGDEMPWTLSPEEADAILNKREEEEAEEIEVEFTNSNTDINQTPTLASNIDTTNDQFSLTPRAKTIPEENPAESVNQFEPDQAKSNNKKEEKIENQFEPDQEKLNDKKDEKIENQFQPDSKEKEQNQENHLKEKQETQTIRDDKSKNEAINKQQQQQIKPSTENQASSNKLKSDENKSNTENQKQPTNKVNSLSKLNLDDIKSNPQNQRQTNNKENQTNKAKPKSASRTDSSSKDNSSSSFKSKPQNRTETNKNQNTRNQLKQGNQSEKSKTSSNNNSIDDDIIRFEPFSKKSKSSKDEIEIILDEDGEPKYPPKKKSEWSFEAEDHPMNLRPVFFSSSRRKKKSSSQNSQTSDASSHNSSFNTNTSIANASFSNSSIPHEKLSDGSPKSSLYLSVIETSEGLQLQRPNQNQNQDQNQNQSPIQNQDLNKRQNEPPVPLQTQTQDEEVKIDQDQIDDNIEDEKISPVIWKVTPSDNPNRPFILSKEVRKPQQQQQQQQQQPNQNQSNQIMSQNPALSSSLLFDSPMSKQNQTVQSPSAKTEVSSSLIFDSPKQQRRQQQQQQRSPQTPRQSKLGLSPIRPANSNQDKNLSRNLLNSPPKAQNQPQLMQQETQTQQQQQQQQQSSQSDSKNVQQQSQKPIVISPTSMRSSDSNVRARQASNIQQPNLDNDEKTPKEDVKTVKPTEKAKEKETEKKPRNTKETKTAKPKPKPKEKEKVPPKKEDAKTQDKKNEDNQKPKQNTKPKTKPKPKSKPNPNPKRNENESEKEKNKENPPKPIQTKSSKPQTTQKVNNQRNLDSDKNDHNRPTKNTLNADATKTNDTSPLSINTSPIKKPTTTTNNNNNRNNNDDHYRFNPNNNNNNNDDHYRFNSNNNDDDYQLNYKHKQTKKRPSNANPYYYNEEYDNNKFIGNNRNGGRKHRKVTVEADFDDSSNDEIISYEPKSKKYKNRDRERRTSHRRQAFNDDDSDFDTISLNNSSDDGMDNKLAYENEYFNFRIGGNNSRYANPMPRRTNEFNGGANNQRPRQATFMRAFHLQNVPLNCSYLPARLKK